MKSESEFDLEVYDLAVKIAYREFKEHSSCYLCEPEDVAGELYAYYRVHTKPLLANANEPINFTAKDLYFELSHIRRRESKMRARIIIESEILDGTWDGNRYFETLEANRMLHLWNDNEKVIGSEASKTPSFPRPLSTQSDFSDLDRAEAYRIMNECLSEEELKVVRMRTEGNSEEQIAKVIGKSQQAVNKMWKKILDKVRNKGL